MKKRFGKKKYKEEVITSKDIFVFKKANKAKFTYKCPEIKKAVRLLLEKYRDMATFNSQGVILGSSMGNISIKYLHGARKDRSKLTETGENPEYLNFATNGDTAKIVWSIDSSHDHNTMSKLLRFEPHTSMNQNSKRDILDNPYKYKKIRWQQK